MKSYREKVLDFHSWIDKADVQAGEDIIVSAFGCDREKAQEILADICERVFDLTIYDEE